LSHHKPWVASTGTIRNLKGNEGVNGSGNTQLE
jgi:hypothetical protein